MSRKSRRKKLSEPREAVIESLSHEGRGITHINGKTVFVFGALPGERVLLQIQKIRRKFDEASTLEVLQPSPQRIQPKCAAFSVCGGCSLQHLSGDDQLALKQQSLIDMMEHAGLKPAELVPPLRATSWGYRRKARLGVKYVPKKGRVLVGFRERSSPFVADMERCEVLIPRVGHRLTDLSELVGSLDARATIPQIEVAADDQHVVLVFRHLEPLSESDLAKLSAFGQANDFYIQLQPGGPDSLVNLYPQEQHLSFRPLPNEAIDIEFGALDFVQVNDELNRQMVSQALDWLQVGADDEVLDLFCGLGNFTLPLATLATAVTGVEGDQIMVDRAKKTARDQQITNTDYFAADLETPDLKSPWMKRSYDRLLLDPPRSGAQAISERIGRFGASKIVYVSCQPSTLVRDATMICSQGYRLSKLGIMDMFPQTAHVESMALFER